MNEAKCLYLMLNCIWAIISDRCMEHKKRQKLQTKSRQLIESFATSTSFSLYGVHRKNGLIWTVERCVRHAQRLACDV